MDKFLKAVCLVAVFISAFIPVDSFGIVSTRIRSITSSNSLTMEVANDPFTRQNRETRKASAADRMVEVSFMFMIYCLLFKTTPYVKLYVCLDN